LKRDLDLIRKLVLAVEEVPTGFVRDNLRIEGYTDEQVEYHSYLLVDAGLAEGVKVTTQASTGPEYRILHLTSAGHDFAAAARNDVVWRKASVKVGEKAGSVTLDVMKELLVNIVKAYVST
jgi:hypothetical protein